MPFVAPVIRRGMPLLLSCPSEMRFGICAAKVTIFCQLAKGPGIGFGDNE